MKRCWLLVLLPWVRAAREPCPKRDAASKDLSLLPAASKREATSAAADTLETRPVSVFDRFRRLALDTTHWTLTKHADHGQGWSYLTRMPWLHYISQVKLPTPEPTAQACSPQDSRPAQQNTRSAQSRP